MLSIKINTCRKIFLFFACFSNYYLLYSQEINYDESKVPLYALPNVLKMENGNFITTVQDWETKRRPEILTLFEENVYGKIITNDHKIQFEVASIDKNALEGNATRKEIIIFLSDDRSKRLILLVYLPNKRKKPVPMFLGLNFGGNQAVHADPGISITKNWTRYGSQLGYKDSFANELSRGKFASRWAIDKILARGYGVATAYYGDLQLDRKDIDSREEGFHKWFYEEERANLKNNEAGAIGIWAWGLSRALDYLIQDKDVDGKKVAVIGHSRLGKAALWAGAQDERFAMVISNNSGEGGAAIARRNFGETIQVINRAFPHWMSYNFKKYDNKEDSLPVDFHQLMALIAPRPLYVASAAEDLWADPKGEYLSLYHASPVYTLYGKAVFNNPEPPLVDQPIRTGVLGYHNRTGKHAITAYDWDKYLDFADNFLK